MKSKIVLITPMLLCASVVNADDSETKRSLVDNFELKPVIIDSENNDSSSLGLDFSLSGKFYDEKFETQEGDDLTPDVVIGGADVSYQLKGLLVEDAESNPKDFLEIGFSANYFRSSSYSMKVGAFIKSESDQKFNDHQFAYGITSTFVNSDNFADNDLLAVHINIGQVDPSEDEARQGVLGDDLDTYDRADVELLYSYNIGTENFDTFEINYRYFVELGADQQIKDAGLDRYRLITYRLGFSNNLHIAYSSGELPFNQQDDQIYEIGFNYKFN